MGNHDWHTLNAQPYQDYFTLPGNERYYTFTWDSGEIEFFILNSDLNEPDGRVITSTQAVWLQTQLSASAARWKIVVFHHTPYTSGAVHGSDVGMQWPFQAWGASAVLAGHEHVYERVMINNFPYITNGLGGHPTLYAFGPPLPGSVVRYTNDWGALLGEVYLNPDRLLFRFVTVNNQVIDTYELPPLALR
jgi:hypothetical protein